MEEGALLSALTTRAIETVGERIVKRLEPREAAASRDALAKNLYARLFDWLVAAINRKISALGTGLNGAAGSRCAMALPTRLPRNGVWNTLDSCVCSASARPDATAKAVGLGHLFNKGKKGVQALGFGASHQPSFAVPLLPAWPAELLLPHP